ncbi:sodium-independent sulfate anion transporter [Trichonephila clavipes]|nr:sodium-independent sulfate anion transporter [Trichonephila clavipes]
MSKFMPSDNDLRTGLIFCYHLKKNATESHQMLVEAYIGNALSRAQCYRWFEKFQNGDFDVLGWETLAHAVNLPDLAPSDYHLFASLRHTLADQHFTSYKNVKSWLDDWTAMAGSVVVQSGRPIFDDFSNICGRISAIKRQMLSSKWSSVCGLSA